MKEIKVFEIVGEHCIEAADGKKIYDLILPELKAGKPVHLNFEGCTLFISVFYRPAIAALLKHVSYHDMDQLLQISNLASEDMDRLKDTMRLADKYYLLERFGLIFDCLKPLYLPMDFHCHDFFAYAGNH